MSRQHCNPDQMDTTNIEYINGLYGYAMILTQDHAVAEDLVYETYVRAIPAVERLPGESNSKELFFKVLRNVWLNQCRKQQGGSCALAMGGQSFPTNGEMEPAEDSCDDCTNKIDEELVRAAIQKLPIELREIILLREFAELSYREIAGVLNCPVGMVVSRLAIARSDLRVSLSSRLTRLQ
jgi:RNA polymerase sigma-70 factor (ECF subfamily)